MKTSDRITCLLNAIKDNNKQIETLQQQLEEYDSIVVGLNYKLAKAQSYIKDLEEQLRNRQETEGINK